MNWYRLIIIFTIFLAVWLTMAWLQDYKYISSIIKLFAVIIIIFVFYNSRKKYNWVFYPANISKKDLEQKVFELYESEKNENLSIVETYEPEMIWCLYRVEKREEF